MKRTIDDEVILKAAGPCMYHVLMKAQHDQEREKEQKERLEEEAKPKDYTQAAPKDLVRQRTFERTDQLRSRYRPQDLAWQLFKARFVREQGLNDTAITCLARSCQSVVSIYLAVEKASHE